MKASKRDVMRMLNESFPIVAVIEVEKKDPEAIEEIEKLLGGDILLRASSFAKLNGEPCAVIFLRNTISGDMYDVVCGKLNMTFGEKFSLTTIHKLARESFEGNIELRFLEEKDKVEFIKRHLEDDEKATHVSEMLEELFKAAKQHLKD